MNWLTTLSYPSNNDCGTDVGVLIANENQRSKSVARHINTVLQIWIRPFFTIYITVCFVWFAYILVSPKSLVLHLPPVGLVNRYPITTTANGCASDTPQTRIIAGLWANRHSLVASFDSGSSYPTRFWMGTVGFALAYKLRALVPIIAT
jgi:hypothetical protein